MFDSFEEFGAALAKVENGSSAPIKKNTKIESALDLSAYDLDPVQEGIIQTGLNKVSNLLGANIKSKISNEWKHLDEEGRLVLLRIIVGDENAYSTENENVDKALAKAFMDKTLSPTKDEHGLPAITVNRDVDLSQVASEQFPDVSITEVNGDLKCNYASFMTLNNFPEKVNSIEFIKGKGHLKDLSGLPQVTGFNAAKYSIDMKYTNLDSLAGWKVSKPIKGHVSFRGCDLKDLKVNGTIYINGILDIRDNKNISVETLKTILLKGYAGGSIIAKAGIYHSLEVDGYYESELIQQDHFVNDTLGSLNEASTQKTAVLTPQAELWAIGPEIIKQAIERKSANQPSATVKDTIQPAIQSKIETVVKDIISNQMTPASVNTASQTIKSGVTSDEFRKMMTTMFDQLIRRIDEMMRQGGNGDSAKVEEATANMASAIADNAAEQLESFGENVDNALKADACPNWGVIDKMVVNAMHTIPKIAIEPLTQVQMHISNLNEFKTNGDRDGYTSEFAKFYGALNSKVLAKPIPTEQDIEKQVEKCFGPVEDEKVEEPAQAPEPEAQIPETPTPEEPVQEPAQAVQPAQPSTTPKTTKAAAKATPTPNKSAIKPPPAVINTKKLLPGATTLKIVNGEASVSEDLLKNPEFISYVKGLSGQNVKTARNMYSGVTKAFNDAGLGEQLTNALSSVDSDVKEQETPTTPDQSVVDSTSDNDVAQSAPENPHARAIDVFNKLTSNHAIKYPKEVKSKGRGSR